MTPGRRGSRVKLERPSLPQSADASVIDLHCHLMPFVDDGADSVEECMALATAASAEGVEHLVLTPHLHPGRWPNVRSMLAPRFDALRRMVATSGLPLTLSLGAEVRLHPESLDLVHADEVPMLGLWEGERVMLTELPHEQVPPGTLQAVKWLRARGIRPLLAHPERNKGLMLDPAKIVPLVEAGCLLQVTAGSIVGAFGEPAMKLAHQLLDEDRVTVVASDSHNLAHRPPMMRAAREALKARWGEERAFALTDANPRAVVSGAAVAAVVTA